MKFTLEIDCDNAAFEDDYQGEVARILRHICDTLTEGGFIRSLHDANGNAVGRLEFTD